MIHKCEYFNVLPKKGKIPLIETVKLAYNVKNGKTNYGPITIRDKYLIKTWPNLTQTYQTTANAKNNLK